MIRPDRPRTLRRPARPAGCAAKRGSGALRRLGPGLLLLALVACDGFVLLSGTLLIGGEPAQGECLVTLRSEGEALFEERVEGGRIEIGRVVSPYLEEATLEVECPGVPTRSLGPIPLSRRAPVELGDIELAERRPREADPRGGRSAPDPP